MLEVKKSKDSANNLYISEEQIKAYRNILQIFPQPSGTGTAKGSHVQVARNAVRRRGAMADFG